MTTTFTFASRHVATKGAYQVVLCRDLAVTDRDDRITTLEMGLRVGPRGGDDEGRAVGCFIDDAPSKR